MAKYDQHEIDCAIQTIKDMHDLHQNPELMAEAQKTIKGMGKITSIKALRAKIQDDMNKEDETDSEKYGPMEMMEPDHKEEPKEHHVKNSKNPTIIGKTYK